MSTVQALRLGNWRAARSDLHPGGARQQFEQGDVWSDVLQGTVARLLAASMQHRAMGRVAESWSSLVEPPRP